MAVAHRLPHHDGACRHLHGHTYVVRVYVRGPVQAIDLGCPESGMVTDFGRIKKFLKQIEAELDHKYANETFDEYPTAERIAVRIYQRALVELEPHLPAGAKVSKIRVYEEYVAPQAFAEITAD